MDPDVYKNFNELNGTNEDAAEIKFDEFSPILKKLNLLDAPITIQDHFLKLCYYLQKHYIDITGWEKLGYEIRSLVSTKN
ncbi:MAG TPA: hypothetical protein GXZ44_03030 [Fermentimonas caenicola]|nr:hypothetical protein [Fermentimonas caenicola]